MRVRNDPKAEPQFVQLCECGCGLPTQISPETRRGRTRGQPCRFRRGHHVRKYWGPCEIEGCGAPAQVQGMCPTHNARILRNGDPHTTEWQRRRLLRIEHVGECWFWAGTRDKHGYGSVRVLVQRGTGRRPSQTAAHRWFYETLIGPIPEGLVLDHLCMNPPCVNPAHLEPVTQGENVRRWWAWKRAQEATA